jgi:hypothetical protein
MNWNVNFDHPRIERGLRVLQGQLGIMVFPQHQVMGASIAQAADYEAIVVHVEVVGLAV